MAVMCTSGPLLIAAAATSRSPRPTKSYLLSDSSNCWTCAMTYEGSGKDGPFLHGRVAFLYWRPPLARNDPRTRLGVAGPRAVHNAEHGPAPPRRRRCIREGRHCCEIPGHQGLPTVCLYAGPPSLSPSSSSTQRCPCNKGVPARNEWNNANPPRKRS